MYSSEGERVQLIQNISTSEAKGAVEKWLVQVEDLMLRSVRDVVARSRLVRSLFPLASMYSSSDTGFLEWILILGMTKGRLSFDLQAHIFHHAGLDFIFCSVCCVSCSRKEFVNVNVFLFYCPYEFLDQLHLGAQANSVQTSLLPPKCRNHRCAPAEIQFWLCVHCLGLSDNQA